MTTSPRRQPQPDLVPLPVETRAALQAIASELRNLPRDCIGDRAELLFWLNRLARRVDAERDRTVVVLSPGLSGSNTGPINGLGRCSCGQSAQRSHATATVRDKAEAAFRPTAQPSTPMPSKPRTVTSRKGRTVRVEVRRRPVKQLQMEFV